MEKLMIESELFDETRLKFNNKSKGVRDKQKMCKGRNNKW